MAHLNNVTLLMHYGSENPYTFSMATILCWLSFFSGRPMADSCRKAITLYLNDASVVDDIMRSVHEKDIASLEYACEIVLHMTSLEDRKNKILPLLIVQAVDDGYITFSEEEFLLFIVDFFAIERTFFENCYFSLVGKSFPPIGDPSSVWWWEAKEHSQGHQNKKYAENTSINGRLHALSLLGLDESATTDDIRKSYLRLVRIHHPDRYQHLGEEEFREAEMSFERIQKAYEYLNNA